MSNSRSFRRSLKVSRHARPSGSGQRQPRGQPWNKGLAMTSRPSLSTVRRWLQVCVDEGTVERKGTQRTGKPGRPAVLYGLTEEGLKLPRTPPEVQKVQWEQVRRRENAWKRRKAQRSAHALNTHQERVAKATRKLKAAQDAVEQAEARLLAAEMTVGALKALENADGDVSVLLPEEIDILTEVGILTEKDGHLLLAENCVEAFDRALLCITHPVPPHFPHGAQD